MAIATSTLLALGALGSAAGGIYGAANQNSTNNQNYQAQLAAIQAQQQRQQQMTGLITPMLQQGQNPYSAGILSFLGQNPAQYAPQQGGFNLGALPQYPTPNTPGNYGGQTNYGGVGGGGGTGGYNPANPGYGGGQPGRIGELSMRPGVSGEAGGIVGATPQQTFEPYTPPTDDPRAPDLVGHFQNILGRMPTQAEYAAAHEADAHQNWDQVDALIGSFPKAQAVAPTPAQGQIGIPGFTQPGYTPPWSQIGMPGFGGGFPGAGGPGWAMPPGLTQGLNQLQPGAGAGGMYRYSPYDVGQLGIPQLGAPGQISVPGFNAPQLGQLGQIGVPGFGGTQLDMSKILQQLAPQVQAPGTPSFQPLDLGIATGSQGFNSGQDALMQFMRAQQGGGPQRDASLTAALQGAGQTFDNSQLFGALAPLDQRLIDQQTSQLQGSFGSLGSRLGSSAMRQEGQLRGQFAENIAARNAQLQSQAFEQGQQRNLQSLGLQTGREQFFAQLPLQQQAQQLQAAQMLQSGGLGQAGLMAQLAQANQGAGIQTGQFGAQQALQAALANQGAGLQAGGQNQSAMLQALLANQQAGQQAGMQTQQLGAQAGQQNVANQLQQMLAQASMQQQAGLQGQQLGFQGQQQNIANLMQQQLAQANLGQQAGQFNIGNQIQQGQFGAQQGNIFNQTMLGGLGQAAGLQNQQTGLNAQLLSILGGMPMGGVAQQQPSAWPGAIGDISQLAMLLPFLNQLGAGGGGGGGASNWTPIGYQPTPTLNIPQYLPRY
jgi:hypothetical protein